MNGLRKTKSNLQCQQKPASQFPTPPMNTCKYRPKYVKNPNCLRKTVITAMLPRFKVPHRASSPIQSLLPWFQEYASVVRQFTRKAI